jgi:hypothetical protein
MSSREPASEEDKPIVKPPLTWGKSTAINIVEGDITEQDVDAIVNAANSTL